MPITDDVAHLRGRVIALKRCVKNGERQPNDQLLADTSEKLRLATFLARVERLIADAPPLTNEQVGNIVGLLRTGGGDA